MASSSSEFPYLKAFRGPKWWQASVSQPVSDVDIDLGSELPFKNLIVTGKNGSGKTTFLERLNEFFQKGNFHQKALFGDEFIVANSRPGQQRFLFAYFDALRSFQYLKVEGPQKIDSELLNYSPKKIGKIISQVLVNREVDRAFAQIQGDSLSKERIDHFVDDIQKFFSRISKPEKVKLSFDPSNYAHFLTLEDGSVSPFSDLPDGLGAAFGVVVDLLIRVFEYRQKVGDFTIDPPGLVLIDEPELHLHIELQYDILPLLTEFFPNIQFIVATHSPAVASSLRNAVVYDLGTRQYAPRSISTMPFSSVMEAHFGLSDDYGPVADEIIKKAKDILHRGDAGDVAAPGELQELLIAHERILSPELVMELNTAKIRLEKLRKAKA